MRVIPKNRIDTVTATSEDANYPASNLTDEHPKKLWIGTGTSETLTMTTETGAAVSALALFNTNATGVSFFVEDPNEIAWESGVSWEFGVEWDVIIVSITDITDLSGDTGGACMVQFDQTIPGAVRITVSLVNNNGDTLFAGVATAGELMEYAGPDFGLTEDIEDLSIVKEMSNGSVYIKDRDQLRKYSMTANMALSDTGFDGFIKSVAREVQRRPAAWLITNINDQRWLVYARLSKMPSGTFYRAGRLKMKCELMEVK